MANFEVLETYNSEIEKLEPTTPGHADVFNAIFQQLINNDAFIKKVAEQQLTIIQSHLNNENEPHQKVFDTYYRQLVNYTDKAIADLINGAPETADTLRELADLIDKNKDVATALNEAIGKKANQTELDQAISDINTLNSGLANKSYIKIIKGDWSGLMGTLTPLFDTSDKVINLIAHNELNDTYPAVRVGRADADHDGNDIPTTYLKKSDAKTMFNTGYRQVSSNEFNKYFSDTWSYVGADGVSIDSGTWLVNYYCWVSESSAVDVISLKSTVDQAIGITAPNNGNGGTWLTMHEIISGKAITNLKFLIKVPKAVTFGQISTKITAIKLC